MLLHILFTNETLMIRSQYGMCELWRLLTFTYKFENNSIQTDRVRSAVLSPLINILNAFTCSLIRTLEVGYGRLRANNQMSYLGSSVKYLTSAPTITIYQRNWIWIWNIERQYGCCNVANHANTLCPFR